MEVTDNIDRLKTRSLADITDIQNTHRLSQRLVFYPQQVIFFSQYYFTIRPHLEYAAAAHEPSRRLALALNQGEKAHYYIKSYIYTVRSRY